jgi:hypothetical protein
MTATNVGSALCPNRKTIQLRRAALACKWSLAGSILVLSPLAAFSQTQDSPPAPPAAQTTPAAPAPQPAATLPSPNPRNPIAIVPIEAANQAQVTGALQITKGTAFILSSGTVTSGAMTTNVILPRRGVLRVCASTSVHLSADPSVPAGETPGLMMALDHGAVEASFATGQNSDTLLTPDFRILIGGPGSSDLKVRLGQHGDTCVDNPGANAPYVLVSSVFEGGAYRVQPGQRVMFQHGSLKEVVDQEREPCGCPPDARPGTNDFPLAQSAGLAPLEKPAPAPQQAGVVTLQPQQQLSEPLVYTAPAPPPAELPKPPQSVPAPVASQPIAAATTPANKKPGFFHRVGLFFRKIFGAE